MQTLKSLGLLVDGIQVGNQHFINAPSEVGVSSMLSAFFHGILGGETDSESRTHG